MNLKYHQLSKYLFIKSTASKNMFYSKLKYLILITITLFSNNVLSEEDKYASVRETIQTCFTCHGVNGVSHLPNYPILAGQQFYYLYVQLKDFKSGLRENAVMLPLIANMNKEDMKLIAEFFSEQKWPNTVYRINAQQEAAGLKVVHAGQCVACHLGSFNGNSRIPRLANQHIEYLNRTMLDFKHKVRNNVQPMNALFATFSEEEIKAVADYLGGFKEYYDN